MSEIFSHTTQPRLLTLSSLLYGVLAVFIEQLNSFQNKPRLIFNLVVAFGGLVIAAVISRPRIPFLRRLYRPRKV